MKRYLVYLVALAPLSACSRTPEHVVPGGNVERGKEQIVAVGCGACHVINGIPTARGQVGPALSGVASRAVIAGVLPNTPDNLTRWIEDAPSISPQTAMPNLGLSQAQARDIAAYLYARQ
jgi:cytochrome c2